MKFIKAYFSLVVVLCLTQGVAMAQIQLSKLFADHMVLQREQPIRVWGWGIPNQSIQVTLGKLQSTTQVRLDSTWEVQLSALPAGGPYSLKVVGDTVLTYEDVWIGDVWIAGGQSNMEWKLSWTVNNWEAEVADSDFPEIRFFDVPNLISPDLQNDLPTGEWQVASPATAGEFSAVAWFFAKRNHLEKGVAVGVIESNWGGTPAEAWTTIETLTKTNGYENKAEEVRNPKIPWEAFIKQNEAREKQKWDLIQDTTGALATGAQNLDFDDTDWEDIQLPNQGPMTDVAWVRRTFSVEDSTQTVRIFIGNIVQNAMVFCNGKLIWQRTWNNDSEVLTLPKHLLRAGDNLLTIRVINDWDNRAFVGRVGEMWIESAGVRSSLEGAWKYSNQIEAKLPEVMNTSWTPSFLYNAMIHPIAGYGARGVIWYQGESNVGENQFYHELFTNMIKDWREAWQNPGMTFLYVQLANFLERKENPEESAWAKLREAQTQTLALEKTGMATIIDIGDAENIHPRNKKDVGDRLWLAARKVSYGDEVEYAGPTYRSHKIKKNKVVVTFDHASEGFQIISGNSPIGFALSGADQKFYWATAKIKGNQIILTAPEVDSPIAVRYAWADNPATNLYNTADLPAVPFRTDDW